eukprot:c15374_g1_i1 orf=91-639(+)
MENSDASDKPQLADLSDSYATEEDGGHEEQLAAHADQLLELRAGQITQASKKEQGEIKELINMWDHDTLDKNARQGTWYTYQGRKIAWRLDNQKNGAVKIDGLYYYVFAVQAGKNVYSNVQVPYLYFLGRERIQQAFIKSMDELKTIRIILPDKGQPQPPAQDDPKARKSDVAQLNWRMSAV